MEVTYKVSDLKKLIKESSNEFKPVIGDNVESEDKKNNGKAYKEAQKRAKNYDGGLSKELGEEKPKYEKKDGNYTTLDYEIENASDDFKKRVRAQVDGYTSVAEKENNIEKTGDFSDNDKIYDAIKNNGQEMHKNKSEFKKTGLQASKMPEKIFKKDEMYESKNGVDMRNAINRLKNNSYIPKASLNEDKKLKTIFFKKTNFLTENHMKSRIPDEFKKEGEQFKMKDKKGEEYIVEWKNGNAEVIFHTNKEKIDESFKMIENLSSYSSKNYYGKSKNNIGVNENKEVNRMLEIIRGINKDKN